MKRLSRHGWQTVAAVLVAVVVISLGIVLFGDALRVLLGPRSPRGESLSETRRTATTKPREDRSGPDLADLVEIDRVTVRMDPGRGGALASSDGAATLDVPPHALEESLRVSMVRFALPEGEDGLGFAYDLQPDGLRLSRAARFDLALPLGIDPEEAEIVAFDPVEHAWAREPHQGVADGGDALRAQLDHFSLRRIRIRPGMTFLAEPDEGRATFYLETDAGNSFERYVEGRWTSVRRGTVSYRDLMRLGRLGRHNLISTGRLRAVTAGRPRPAVFRDDRRTVAMPRGSPQARTGWVRIQRLDEQGEPNGPSVIARVNDYGPGPRPRRAGVIVDLSRATMEALGLVWGEDFGLSEENPDLAWIRVRSESGRVRRYVPVRVEAYEAQPPRVPSCRLW